MDEPLPRFEDANALRRSDPAAALPLFRQLWEKRGNPWAGWGYAQCLRKQGDLETAIQVCREALAHDSENKYLRTELAWALYGRDLKRASENKDLDAVLGIAKEILSLDSDHLTHKKVALKVIQTAKANQKWRIVLEWAGRFAPEDFDLEPYPQSQRRMMSERETFYSAYARALHETSKHADARQVAQRGLAEFPNSLFLARTAALALAEQGGIATAAQEMRQLVNRPGADWYFKAELANMELQLGRTEEAYRLACEAALKAREDEQRVNLFLILARAALLQRRVQVAAEHVTLAKLVRVQNDWKIPNELAQLEMEISTAAQELGQNIALSQESRELHRTCREHWQAATKRELPIKSGRMGRIDASKPYAFIYPDDHSSLVFVRMKEVPRTLAFEGAQVEFELKPSFDKKKNRESVEATKVRQQRAGRTNRDAG